MRQVYTRKLLMTSCKHNWMSIGSSKISMRKPQVLMLAAYSLTSDKQKQPTIFCVSISVIFEASLTYI